MAPTATIARATLLVGLFGCMGIVNMLDYRPSVVFILIIFVGGGSIMPCSVTCVDWYVFTRLKLAETECLVQVGGTCVPCSRVHRSHTADSLLRFLWSCTAAHTRRWAYCSGAIFCDLGKLPVDNVNVFCSSLCLFARFILQLCNFESPSHRNVLGRNSYAPNFIYITSFIFVPAAIASWACLSFGDALSKNACVFADKKMQCNNAQPRRTFPRCPDLTRVILRCTFPPVIHARTKPRAIPQTPSSWDTVGWTRPISRSTMTRMVLGQR